MSVKVSIKPFPDLLSDETVIVDARWAKEINDHCQAMFDEINRLRTQQ